MTRYSKKAGEKVEKAMHEMKRGTLRSGRRASRTKSGTKAKAKAGKSGKKVTSRKQAIAIGLSEARRAGAKVPPPRRRSSRSSRRS